MTIKKYNLGFTLIELLVVVGVIAVVSTLTVIYLETARMTARDARRIADIKQLQLALKMYYNDTGSYPEYISPNESIANGNTVYLANVPANPTPRTDNNCPDQDYQYKQLEGGNRYSLTFCLGDKTDDLSAGERVATHNGILNCPKGYLVVPGSRDLKTNDFCVMQYEAKCAPADDLNFGMKEPATADQTYSAQNGAGICAGNINDSGRAVSIPSGYPIADVTLTQAKAFCQKVGAHLITNAEWTTIVRNAEGVFSADEYNSNWSGGAIGEGGMPTGIDDRGLSDEAFEEYHVREHTQGPRRTLILSTGKRIWDLAGSVSELVDNSCEPGDGIGKYNSGELQWDNSALDDYERPASGPSSAAFFNHAVGTYLGCSDTGNMFIRGGNAQDNDFSDPAGVYNLNLQHNSMFTNALLGFRCVMN